ncbi:MAG: hypothetical protein AAGB02_04800 [Pseudomonadota bacterium]
MPLILLLIFIGVAFLIGFHLWNAGKANGRLERGDPNVIDGKATDISTPGKAAASALRDFDNARARLQQEYPSVTAMLGGYLNAHAIGNAGSLEAAAKEMIADWVGRREEVARELTRLLADNTSEDEVRAIVVASCDAEFDQEGYRAWLTWLLGQFNEVG